MEGNISSGNMNMIQGSSYGGIDIQGAIRSHHQQHQQYQQQPPLGFHSHARQGLMICNQNVSLSDYGKGEGGKSASDDEEANFTEDGGEGQNGQHRGKKAPMWHRVKWTDQMVRLLITAVSYIGEEASAEYSGRRKCTNLHKKGKWKSISKVMAERGHFVSPQQCEDKFNDLNKRYKRLNEILGRGTSCEVVENPSLLDMMEHVSDKAKDEVRKILSSKHLHYEEMCSYHNSNRLHLPHDPELQRSLRLALRTRDDNDDGDVRRPMHDDNDEDDLDAELDEHDEYEENHMMFGPAKKMKQNSGFGTTSGSLDCNKTFGFQPQISTLDASLVPFDDSKENNNQQKRWMDQRSLQLEEQKLQIQAQMLEVEKERLKWQRFSQKKSFELEMIRMENEKMKLENERMALELKRKEMHRDNS